MQGQGCKPLNNSIQTTKDNTMSEVEFDGNVDSLLASMGISTPVMDIELV